MAELDGYRINLNALHDGEYHWELHLDNAFFQGLEQEEIQGGDIAAAVNLTARSSGFVVRLNVQGEVVVTCDRCLDPMHQSVSGEETLLVKLGNPAEDAEDETIYVEPADGWLDLSWLLYELTELSLPIVHSHQPGECNPQMEELLRSHLCTTVDSPEDNN